MPIATFKITGTVSRETPASAARINTAAQAVRNVFDAEAGALDSRQGRITDLPDLVVEDAAATGTAGVPFTLTFTKEWADNTQAERDAVIAAGQPVVDAAVSEGAISLVSAVWTNLPDPVSSTFSYI